MGAAVCLEFLTSMSLLKQGLLSAFIDRCIPQCLRVPPSLRELAVNPLLNFPISEVPAFSPILFSLVSLVRIVFLPLG